MSKLQFHYTQNIYCDAVGYIINAVAFTIRDATKTRWVPHWIHYTVDVYNFVTTYSYR